MGIGRICVGRLARGFVILFIGISLAILGFLAFFGFFAFIAGCAAWKMGLLSIVAMIVGIVLRIWQTFDAYGSAKRYNEHVYEHGKAPWRGCSSRVVRSCCPIHKQSCRLMRGA